MGKCLFFQLYANTHAFSQLVLVPWGYTMEEYKYHDRVMEVVGPVGKNRAIYFCQALPLPSSA